MTNPHTPARNDETTAACAGGAALATQAEGHQDRKAGRMECGVCWYVYDPAQGCDVWQVDPNTAFADLPEHWRCPECDAEKHKFLVVDDGGEALGDDAQGGMAGVDALLAAYRRVDAERMQDLPFRNPKLGVDGVGFRTFDGGALGVVITPWFMNLMFLAGEETDWTHHRHGDLVPKSLPSGIYDFVHGDLEGFGLVQSCSLQSPVLEFEDMDAARATAHEVMRLLLSPPEGDEAPGPALKGINEADEEASAEPSGAPKGPISRREFLRGPRGGVGKSDE